MHARRGGSSTELQRELVADRARIVAENKRIEAEIGSLLEESRDGSADEVDRGDAAAAVRFDDALERLSLQRLDAIDRALDAMDRGTFGTLPWLRRGHRARPPARRWPMPSLCIRCAREAEARA